MANHDDDNGSIGASGSNTSHPKTPNCYVSLDRKEFESAALKYLPSKQSPGRLNNYFFDMDSDSDDDRLEIDEEAISMPALDVQGVEPVAKDRSVSIQWAPENNPKYGSATILPKEPKKRKRYLKKEYVDAGTQQRDEDIQRFCNECMQGKALRAKLEIELAKRGTSINELTNGGPIGPDLIEKVKALIENPQKSAAVQVSSMQVKRITQRALPELLPLGRIAPPNNVNQDEANVTSTFQNNDGLYTEENIRMSHIQFMQPFNAV